MLQADTSDVLPPCGWFCHTYSLSVSQSAFMISVMCFHPAAGWRMRRSPGIREACANVYDFGQSCSGTFGKQTILKHFHNLKVGSLLWHDVGKFSI